MLSLLESMSNLRFIYRILIVDRVIINLGASDDNNDNNDDDDNDNNDDGSGSDSEDSTWTTLSSGSDDSGDFIGDLLFEY